MGIGKNQYGQTYNFRSGTYSRPLRKVINGYSNADTVQRILMWAFHRCFQKAAIPAQSKVTYVFRSKIPP